MFDKMEKLERIKEYLIGALATIGAPISDTDKLSEIDRLLLECLNKEIDTILNEQQRVKNLNIPAVSNNEVTFCPYCHGNNVIDWGDEEKEWICNDCETIWAK